MAVETGRPQDLDPDTVAAAAEEQGKPKMLPAHPKLRTPPKMAGVIGLGLSDASTGKARRPLVPSGGKGIMTEVRR